MATSRQLPKSTPSQLPEAYDPPLAFRFAVFFFIHGKEQKTVDTLFQKVSGIGATVETYPVEEGGQNLYSQKLPKKIQYENLVLERGLVVASSLTGEFETTMSQFKFSPCNIQVYLLDNSEEIIGSWLFMTAYPVKWSVSSLDANANTIVVEYLEFCYQRMQSIKL